MVADESIYEGKNGLEEDVRSLLDKTENGHETGELYVLVKKSYAVDKSMFRIIPILCITRHNENLFSFTYVDNNILGPFCESSVCDMVESCMCQCKYDTIFHRIRAWMTKKFRKHELLWILDMFVWHVGCTKKSALKMSFDKEALESAKKRLDEHEGLVKNSNRWLRKRSE